MGGEVGRRVIAKIPRVAPSAPSPDLGHSGDQVAQFVPIQVGDRGQAVDVPEQVVHAPEEPAKLWLALATAEQHAVWGGHEFGQSGVAQPLSPSRHARIAVNWSLTRTTRTLRETSNRICSGSRMGWSRGHVNFARRYAVSTS